MFQTVYRAAGATFVGVQHAAFMARPATVEAVSVDANLYPTSAS